MKAQDVFMLVLIVVSVFGQPNGTGKQLRFGWIAWALVVLALIGALLVSEQGWPKL